MALFLMVCLGGAFGTALRYLIGVTVQGMFGHSFPAGTLVVNLVGSFLISMFMYLGVDKNLIGTSARIVLCTGVMGGFTTYSTFNYETLQYLQEGAWAMAGLNVATTLLLCLAAGALGVVVARGLLG